MKNIPITDKQLSLTISSLNFAIRVYEQLMEKPQDEEEKDRRKKMVSRIQELIVFYKKQELKSGGIKQK